MLTTNIQRHHRGTITVAELIDIINASDVWAVHVPQDVELTIVAANQHTDVIKLKTTDCLNVEWKDLG